MFSFFKRKSKPDPQTGHEAAPPAPASEAPAGSENTISQPAATELPVTTPAMQEEAAAVAVEPEPQAIPEPEPEPAAPVAAVEPSPVPVVVASEAAAPRKQSWSERLKAGLSKTRDKLGKQLAGLFGGGQIDEDLYDELETILLTSDMGVAATQHLLEDVRRRVSLKGLKDASQLKDALKESLMDLIGPLEKPLDLDRGGPLVIMMAGVNGAGKTTSIGKLAKYFQGHRKSVLLAAGDTFRAAAREQLAEWGTRNQVTVISQQGGDAAAVCFDAVQAAQARKIDIVLADTAGRLPTQLHLMEEIRKVKRVISKALPQAPHEILLVLDANTGQNALAQVKAFDDALGLTGLILTKLDGTAKGGVIAAIARERPVPMYFVGVGETLDDLRPFSAREYVDALFD
ncbi:signal recognition particle-docking protein FtsY [Laribacter hongkongensis]|uniref:signal recognition particle-docking protein FtsY n=1 Tax=Laribacter hongkongensis TaxID=168471 RepID=UPI001EFD9FEF|nr:signal recognition particle-docking protein FtsY [Laribacter hongkongensis]MCG8993750.1 signal recognition particle-docking protein FtsY [Laribacter hongkongensis]MCG8999754.1 signal recognition particle-docking protein FtsY [Laribacter hongkongensis]MCG9002822.1 signal recognition particle-docking protein FtsY [Laribacter hongkongensis]MCG9005851.1 signal recognition particle-docking protein FtsY [Laribacter hongkongensis]MCG9008846.1 signal recognition particle-docking protein FtsY [Larib